MKLDIKNMTIFKLVLTFVVGLICVDTLTAQRARVVREIRATEVRSATTSEPQEENQEKKEYEDAAPLKTDPDLDDRLDKANEFRDDGNFRVAAKLWQSVLMESGDILASEDKETYYSMTDKVEKILASLPASGLSSYRISADAAAREILAQGKGDLDEETLNRVVKRYFMSSFGDDAAYKLGCLYLDRYDFVGAARMLRKITEQYPDPSIPMEDVWMRIAIAYVYVGDQATAAGALKKAEEAGADPESRLFESITELLADMPQLNSSVAATRNWTTRFGASNRRAQMPALPESYLTNLKADWQYHFGPQKFYKEDTYLGETITSFAPEQIAESITKGEKNMIEEWRKGNWRPAGNLLFTDKLVAFRTASDVTVWNRELQADPFWRPLWLNEFRMDDATYMWQEMYNNMSINRSGSAKTAPQEGIHVQMYGDQIAQCMGIHRGVLYCIEGPEYSWKDGKSTNSRNRARANYNSTPRRTRLNRLAAYNLNNGKIKWRLPTPELLKVAKADHDAKAKTEDDDEETSDEFSDIGFMAAPIGFGDLLLVPVNVSGSIWVYALDSTQQGALVWKSYLCDEPGGGAQPWSPIHIALEGSSAYVNCGTGVVFSLDPMTGGVQYARRYHRSGKMQNVMAQYGNSSEVMDLDGWSEDLVVPVGKDLVMFASDYNVVWAIDRETAQFSWLTNNRPFGNKFDYLIGMNDEYIYLGGSKSVAAISIKAQGRWAWVHSLGEDISRGRGMLTKDGIYIPLEDKIIKLDLQGDKGSGKVLNRMDVRLGTEAPIGNLFSDGDRIWVVGGNRLYALGPDDGSIPDYVPEPPKPKKSEGDQAETKEDEDSDDK